MRRIKWLLMLSLAAGCGGSGVGSQSSGLDLPPISFDVPTGAEVQNCLYMKIPNDKDIDIGKVVMNFSEGTHHVQVYYSDQPHDDGIESCFQAVDFERWHLLAATQKKTLEWELPPGVGFHLHAHQQMLVQVHFVNVGKLLTTNNKGTGTIHFDTRDSKQIAQHMGSIFGQQRLIDIKPYASYSVDGICRLPRAVNMAALAGHYHFNGKDFMAYKLEAGATSGTQFYQTSNFAEPQFDVYAPGQLTFAADQRIMWHCDYQNDGNTEVTFGPRELTQEHCNMFAFYYPAATEQEFLPCVSWGRCQNDCDIGETCSELGECVPKAAP